MTADEMTKTEATTTAKAKKWLDFSAYDLRLRLAKTDRSHYLVLTGKNMLLHEEKAKKLRYNRVEKTDTVMVRSVRLDAKGELNDIDKVKLAEYAREFPNVKEVDWDDERDYSDQTKTPTAKQPTGVVAMAGASRVIGMNRVGQQVLEADNGRFVQDQRGKLWPESDSGNANPGLYLRAKDKDSLAACAEGFMEMAFKNKVLRAEDFDTFLAAIYPAPPAKNSPEHLAAIKAIEAASARQLVRRGGTSQSSAFVAADKINKNLAFMNGRQRPAEAGMASPMAVAAQRLLGTDAALKGRKVVVVNPGYGHVLTHLPRTIDLSLAGNVPEFEVNMVLAATGIKGTVVSEDTCDKFACDAQIADMPRTVGAATKTAAGPFKRKDLAAALSLLDNRNEDGVSVLVFDAPANAAEDKEFAAFRDHVAARYAFDGESHVDGSLSDGRVDSRGRIMMSVGWRRPKPLDEALPPEPREVRDWGTLWSWTAEVVTSRTQIDREDPKATDAVEFHAGTSKAKRNDYQVPYVSASAVAPPTTMVPRNLEGSTRAALARIVQTYGGIDAFVAGEFGYDHAELKEIFSAEQVDALALFVHAENRGRGFLLADQMGVGKGRTLAAIQRRSLLNGRKVLFTTEKQTNLSDIWRDIVHTKSAHLFKPMILNDGVSIIDEKTKSVVMRSSPREDVEAMLESGAWPEGVNAVFATYSQYTNEVSEAEKKEIEARRRGGGQADDDAGDEAAAPAPLDRNRKARWLMTAIDPGTDVLLDECHNAASGDSNVSKNLAHAVKLAKGVVYSSATFAHKAKHMAFYSRLLPDELSAGELDMMLEKGGETFQEVLSGMLVHDGVMIRREFDLSKVTHQTVYDSGNAARNCAYMDAIAPILSEIAGLSADIDAYVERVNRDEHAAPAGGRRRARPAVAGPEDEAGGRRRRGQRNALARVGYGAPLYTISRLFVAALKVDKTVELALDALRNDQKPVILVENTVQSLLEEIAENDPGDGSLAPDFKVLFNRVLNQTTSVRLRGDDSKARRNLADSEPAIAARAAAIKELINRIPHLPISSIDEVKSRIAAGGWTIGEITGRTLEVRDGKVLRRTVPNPVVEKNNFNSGAYDAIVINVAGSTGIDLHASVRFDDQRPRHMFELQSPADILRKIQAYGRINRLDQVHDPLITTILTGLPVEMRLAAMENAKLRRLSANTTSNRDAAVLTRGIPDLINPVGDTVCARYAESHPDLIRRLGMRVADVQEMTDDNLREEEMVASDMRRQIVKKKPTVSEEIRIAESRARGVVDTKRTANELLARLIMLPVALQQRVCTELTAEFYAAIEELEAKGETPLRTFELPGVVHPRPGPDGKPMRKAFEGAEVENPDSVFNEPLYIVEAALERTADPIKSDALLQMVEIGEMGSGRMRPCIDRLKGGVEEILEPYLPDGTPDVAAALAAGLPQIVKRKAMLDKLVATLETLKPGSEITYTIDEQPVVGVVTRVSYPDKGYEHVPGIYGIEFAVPNDEKPRSMRLETLLRDPGFAVRPGLDGENYDALLKKFDDAVHMKLTNVKLLLNNIYRGMKLTVEHGLGSLRVFKMADGTVHRGIVISPRFRGLDSIPVEITGPAMATAAVTADIELTADARLADKMLVVKKTDNDVIQIRLPSPKSRKYGFIYEEPRIAALLRRDLKAGQGADSAVAILRKVELPEIMNAFHLVGVRFWCNSLKREWATGWLTQHNQAALCGADPRADEREAEHAGATP